MSNCPSDICVTMVHGVCLKFKWIQPNFCHRTIYIAHTQQRRSCCGLARVSCWTRLTATTSWCSAYASPSQTPLVTSVLSLTVNAAKRLVQAFHFESSRLLQFTAVRRQRWTTLLPSVGAECCRPTVHRFLSLCPHHTSVTAACTDCQSISESC